MYHWNNLQYQKACKRISGLLIYLLNLWMQNKFWECCAIILCKLLGNFERNNDPKINIDSDKYLTLYKP